LSQREQSDNTPATGHPQFITDIAACHSFWHASVFVPILIEQQLIFEQFLQQFSEQSRKRKQTLIRRRGYGQYGTRGQFQ